MEQKRKDELEQMVERVQRGDQDAIELLVEMLDGPMYSFLGQFGIPAIDLPDVVAELLESLFDRGIGEYRAKKGSSFWSWLCVVMANEATDRHRRRQRVPEKPDSEYIERTAANFIAVERVSPPSADRLIQIEAFKDAFARLSGEEQDLLRLKIVAGMTYEQIVEESQAGARPVSKKTLTKLRVRLLRAAKKVRIWMAADPRITKLDGEIQWKKVGSSK